MGAAMTGRRSPRGATQSTAIPAACPRPARSRSPRSPRCREHALRSVACPRERTRPRRRASAALHPPAKANARSGKCLRIGCRSGSGAAVDGCGRRVSRLIAMTGRRAWRGSVLLALLVACGGETERSGGGDAGDAAASAGSGGAAPGGGGAPSGGAPSGGGAPADGGAPGGGCGGGFGIELCANGCTNTHEDTSNCGACGNVCASSEQCVGGFCSCPFGTDSCFGDCVDLDSNPKHCGACGNACGPAQICAIGACVCACPAGTTQCGSAGQCLCVNTLADLQHCGGCNQPCKSTQICASGMCVTL